MSTARLSDIPDLVMRPLYQEYSKEEDRTRTNLHYARSSEFFQTVTGGEWHVYSCNIWNAGLLETGSQTAKLDMLARLADLRPGQRLLDLGCGWGGPLVYLCKTFAVSGVGITLSDPQKQSAEALAARHGVDVRVVVCHWKDFHSTERFDFIYSDEVLVHIRELEGLFRKLGGLLARGGSMIHKELHLTHPDHAHRMTRGSSLINEVFGATGNYRTLAEEIDLLARAGLECRGVHSIPPHHYRTTIDRWIGNMKANRTNLINLEGHDFYNR